MQVLALDDDPFMLKLMTRLRLKGFHLSIDDFGTGHASLLPLRDMPFEQLKVDRGFVHNAHADRTQRAIYDASLGVARQRETRCDWVPGYFIGRPMPLDELTHGRAAWQCRMVGESLCSEEGCVK